MIETDCDSHSGETRLLETKPHPHLQEVMGEGLKASWPIRLAGCKGALWLLGGRRGWDFSVSPPLLYVCYACSLFLAGHSEKNGVSSSSGMFSSLVVSIFPTGIFLTVLALNSGPPRHLTQVASPSALQVWFSRCSAGDRGDIPGGVTTCFSWGGVHCQCLCFFTEIISILSALPPTLNCMFFISQLIPVCDLSLET